MTEIITIRETGRDGRAFMVTVQFGGGAPYEISISDPFDEDEEKRLEWYFETWRRFPFTEKARAARAAESIGNYGRALFEQVFRANPDMYMEYQDLRREDLLLEIAGTPAFHELHWETMWDPNQERPLAVEAPIVRRNLRPVPYRATVQDAPVLRVLLLTARPAGRRDISYRTISRPLVDALETARIPAEIDIVRPGTFAALVEHLEDKRDEYGDGYYHIVHLDMHGALLTYNAYQEALADQGPIRSGSGSDGAREAVGSYTGYRAFLFFDDDVPLREGGGGDPVSAEEVAALFNARQVPIIVLNACQSGKQVGEAETSLGSRLIAAGAQLVLAMGYSVTVSAARMLMTTLYRQLLAGKDPAVALRRTRLELYNDKRRHAAYGQVVRLEDWMLPVVYQNRAPHFNQEAFGRGEIPAVMGYRPPRTLHRFVGRDIDILNLERRLLHRRNIQLVRGMGGAGKTTLLHHLGWWWQKTRFVGQVFYFGYDTKAYRLHEMISMIGRSLGLNMSGIASSDRALVLRALRADRHLLILDNLESVTGNVLAVQNTLTVGEQEEVRDFLCDLVGGRTLALLGSRGGEAWLRPDPLRDVDVYDLPGLDYEAQTELANEILRGAGAPDYPSLMEHAADFQRLLKLLGGYPLAMEVVLANLRDATPGEVIDRLRAADVNLDNQEEAAQKTESILKCIDYSHSNLSVEAQALLLCLAPFSGAVKETWLEQYSGHLRTHEELADLPFDRWLEVLQEAVNWGLVQPLELIPEAEYLHLQPIFPYFLKARLHETEAARKREAIETAFRAHYEDVSRLLSDMLLSNEAVPKQYGRFLTGVEYENLMSALAIALRETADFIHVFDALDWYLIANEDHGPRIELARLILAAQPAYERGDSYRGHFDHHFVLVAHRLGTALHKMGDLEQAEAVYMDNLERIEKLERRPDRDPDADLASTYNQLGSLAQQRRNWFMAETYFENARELFANLDEYQNLAGTLHNLGWVAQQQGPDHWEEAEEYYINAVAINRAIDDRLKEASEMFHLGMLMEEKGQEHWEEAQRYLTEAWQIFAEYGDGYGQARVLHAMGILAQRQEEWEKAKVYYEGALRIYIENDDRQQQAAEYHQLGTWAEEQEKFEDAVSYLLEALAIFAAYDDPNQNMSLWGLARIFSAGHDDSIPQKMADGFDMTVEEAQELLGRFTGGEEE